MFQNYTEKADKSAGPGRLASLRQAMKASGVTHFLVPHADEHQNEYLPESAERLAWLTGFTGSAGFAIASLEHCHVFVDGRYTIQVREQVDLGAFTPESLIDRPPSKWLEEETASGHTIGYDPWVITIRQLEAFEKSVGKSGAALLAVENLVDRIWSDRPAPPMQPVRLHPAELAGREASEKIADLTETLAEKNCDLAILTDPASLAWAFNIRGSDVVHNPLALGFAMLKRNCKPVLFIDGRKLAPDVRTALETIAEIREPAEMRNTVASLSRDKAVLCDPDCTPVALAGAITEAGGKIVHGRDPVSLPRAIKNETEIGGARRAHLRDGVAMATFLCWLDGQAPQDLSEISVSKKLEECRHTTARRMGSELREISFDTISGFGPNGAITHYRVTEHTNRAFEDNAIYLCDSGAQYADGTTDITRTIAIGTPPGEAVRDFTLVLKGHIALARARFPAGTRGVDLDVLARNALWREGKDYAHGTGHGIGSYLNVHEGPQNISKRGMEPLAPGMIISNEPGYYVEGQYGIRIENLILVTPAEAIPGGTIETHSFETLTLCPIDLRLVDAAMLSEAEKAWLNAYHVSVCEALSGHLDGADLDWLKTATRAI